MSREEVAEAVHSLRAGNSPGVDNIPSDLHTNGDKATVAVLTAICQKIWETAEWPTDHDRMDTITSHTFTKERKPQSML